MPSDDMDSIPGLEENHRRALAGKLGIISLQALADADQRAIYTALATLRPRPSLARIAAWQGQARSMLSGAAGDPSAWQNAASFAVIFAQRRVDGEWERRIEAEQTELEPALEPRQWPGWDCGPLCDWMLGQLGLPEDEKGSAGEPAASAPPAPAASAPPAPAASAPPAPAASAPPAPAGRAELRIDSATITDAVHELDLIAAGHPSAAPPNELRHPVRLRFTVSGGRSGQQLRAAAWFRRRAEPGWSPEEPVTVSPSGQAEFDLSSVPPGGHDVRLLAWASDPAATMAAVSLPRLTFRPQAGQGRDEASS
jgi:hypothetical protein